MNSDRWLGVELRHLAALQAVVEEGSFSRAAARLGYAQSAVSQQIAMLERLVGEQLLIRPGGRRPVTLTEAGRLLVRHADAIMARLAAAQADLAALAGGQAGTLRVGTWQSTGARVLPELLRRFRRSWPQVDVQLVEVDGDDEMLRFVERGELDLTFAMLPLPEGPFAYEQLLVDPYVLLVEADSPLASEPPSLRRIAELPLIGYRGCRHCAQVEQHLRSRGYEPNIIFRSDDNGTVQGLVRAGVGAALVPALCVDRNDDEVAVLDLGSKVPPRLIALAWHRDRHLSAAARAFVDTAREVCAEVAESLEAVAA